MFKGFNNRQQHSFPNINFGGNYGQAYNFSRCLLWLDAAYGTSTVVNGASISSWVDKINGVTYSQPTAGGQPTYVASDASFNNFPTISFPVGATRSLIGSSTFPLGSSTIALIVRSTSTTVLVGNLILGDGSTLGFFGGGNNANITGYGFYGAGALALTKSNIEDTSMHIIIANRNFIIIDGVNQTNTTSAITQNFTSIGSSSSNYSGSCNISEILLYDYLMSEADAIQLSSNINAKYLKY
jgi:hypothetical protein